MGPSVRKCGFLVVRVERNKYDDCKALSFCGASAKKFFDARDVLGHVHFDAFVGFDFADSDAIAVFHPTELFELFDAFELAGRKRGEFEKSVTAKCVQTDVFEVAGGDAFAGIANPRNRRAREIESVAVEVGNDFDDVGIHDVFGRSDRDAKRGNVSVAFGGEERIDSSIDHFVANKREIALDVHVNVCGHVDGDFGDAVGAGAMLGASHDDGTLKGLDGVADAGVVGGDNNAGGAAALLSTFENVLDHGASGDGRKRLSGKARRRVASRNNDDDGWFRALRH